jgi:hypothetical protein
MEYKNVKIPAWAYENAVAARSDLLRRGLDALPEEVREPRACPRCGAKMEPFANGPGFECSAGCGYRQDRIEGGGVALGVLLGLGVTALLESLGTPSGGEMAAERSQRLRAARDAAAELRRQAKAHGTDKLTTEDVEAEIKATRRDRRSLRKP